MRRAATWSLTVLTLFACRSDKDEPAEAQGPTRPAEEAQKPPEPPSPSKDKRAAGVSSKPPSLPIPRTPPAFYTASVFTPEDEAAKRALVARVAAARRANGILLNCYAGDGPAVISLAHHPTRAQAEAALANPDERAKRTYGFALRSGHDDGAQPDRIQPGDFVQWSEFLLREASGLDPLANLVEVMTSAMVQGQPTLRLTREWVSFDGRSIALLAAWTNMEGFEELHKSGKFRNKPYWKPYAENEHWMCEVAGI